MLTVLKTIKNVLVHQDRYRVFWNVLFYAVIAVTICLFVYKADYTGTTYDESLSFTRFCDSIYTARHTFDTPNNHVLNSIYVFFSGKLFRFYEQYIRIFPMLSGVLFFAGIAYIVKKLFTSPAFQAAAILLIFSVPYIFNFLFMARGYTYGLSGTVLYIALLFYLVDHPIEFRYWPVPVILFSVLNFYVLGAMLSGIYIMFFLNGLFVLLFSSAIYKKPIHWFLSAVLHAGGIALLSGAALYLLYRPILTEVMHIYDSPFLASTIKAWKGWPSFPGFFSRLLHLQVFDVNTWAVYLYYICLVLIGVGFVSYVMDWVKAIKRRYAGAFYLENRKGVYVFLVSLVYCLTLIIYGGVLGRCPGLVRSHLCLLPLVCLFCLWLIERFIAKLSEGRFKSVCICGVWLLIIITALHKTPYLHSVGHRGMAMSKPTLRRLKDLDPEMTWNIVFSRSMYTYSMEFRYYQQFDKYKFNLAAQTFNVLICRPQDRQEQGICLHYEYFIRQNECYVYIMIKPDWKKMILQVRPLIRE